MSRIIKNWSNKRWQELTMQEKADITRERLANPDMKLWEFAEAYNVLPSVVKKLEHLVSYDEDTAMSAVLWKILENDSKLLELSSDVNVKFAKQVSWQRTLKGKDLETLDKLWNTALKRQALVSNNKKWEDWEDAPVTINITF